MNKLPILAFALAPFVAMASPPDSAEKREKKSQSQSQLKVEKQKLQKATPVTAILDEEVFSQQGEEVGNLEDIVISQDGKVKNFIVDVDMQNTEDREQRERRSQPQESEWEQAGDSAERTTERTAQRAETSMPGEGRMSLEPASVQYDSQNDRVMVSKDELKQAGKKVYEDSQAQGELKLSEIVGMEVNLQNEESFGDVEDIMLSEDSSEVVALVVDNWDGFEKHRRALPMQDAQIDMENETVTFNVSASQVEQLPDFNLDNYTDEGWDLANWID